MKKKNINYIAKLILIAAIIFVLYLILPKVYINEQSLTIEKEAFENYKIEDLLEGHTTKNSKIYIHTNLGWKDTNLEDEVSLEEKILLKVITKASFISTDEYTVEIKGIDSTPPKIIINDDNLEIEGGENLGDHLNFDVYDYHYGEYDYALKKPSIDYVPLTLGQHTFTIKAKDLKGNETTKDINFKVIDHTIDENEASKYSVWINKTRKLHKDYQPELKDVPTEYTEDKEIQLETSALDNFLQLADEFEKEFGKNLILKDGYNKKGNPELQSGLAIRLNISDDFDKTEEYEWLTQNAHNYGYIFRYPEDKKDFTNFEFNPSFLRYVDKDISKHLYDNNLSLDEYHIKQ